MKVLVVGGGGREHALCWKIRQSPLVAEVVCAPGNAGIARDARCVPVRADDVEGQLELAERERVDLVVVGPEKPLALGIADRLKQRGIPVAGPTQAAARIESSKAFAKDLMLRAGIPTARGAIFDDVAAATSYLAHRPHDESSLAVVVKADGLAAGKGVFICDTPESAREALERLLTGDALGEAGRRVVIEDRLPGREASVIGLSNGTQALLLPAAEDHKRLCSGDLGPMTGGMGAVSPAPAVDARVEARTLRDILLPALAALAERESPFCGFLYAGLMVEAGAPCVLEFNARLGDPEAQVVLPRLQGDLVPALASAARGEGFGTIRLDRDPRAACCVVLAAPGYPEAPRLGQRIYGLELAERVPGITLFHGATRREGDAFLTNGGRVLCLTAQGEDLTEAVTRAYDAVAYVAFSGMQMRTDIGGRGPIVRT